MPYKLILVDDEDDVRGRIASKIERENDFKIIGSASNGYDALDLLEEEVPDVVITDIKMPFIDGIELTRIIKERFPTVGVAIISGYDDYTYLKDAINLDVIAYLSKPIADENVREFLKKIKKSLDEENEHIRVKENAVLGQIRDQIIHLYLSDYDLDMDMEEMAQLDIDIGEKIILVSTEIIDFNGSLIEFEKKKNQCFLLVEEAIGQKFKSIHTIYERAIVSIIEVGEDEFEKELDILLYKILNYLLKFASVKLAIGVSERGEFKELASLYRQSQMVVDEYRLTRNSRINYYDNLNDKADMKLLNEEEIHEFKRNIRYMSKNKFEKYTKKLAKKLKSDLSYDYFSIMLILSGLVLEYASSIDFNINLDINLIKRYVDDKKIEDFMDLIYRLSVEIKEEVISRDSKRSVKVMDKIMGYIDENFANPDMNMDMVCDTFHISISYLSALFKKETETTFNRYLISKRIEHAKMLLRHTDEKTVEIAEKCGYKDVYYFSHSFKKVTGLTPKGYRKDETL